MHSIFIGNSYLNPLTDPKNCAVFMANVTFEPGCRNNWHIHHAAKGGGQLLICTAGVKDMAAIEVNGDLPYKTVQRYPDRNARRSWHRYIRS